MNQSWFKQSKSDTRNASFKDKKEIRVFLGKLHFISKFLVKLTTVYKPIFKLLRKNQLIEWNEQCHIAFEKIKDYLANRLVLKPYKEEIPLILYLAIEGNTIHDASSKGDALV